MNKNEIIVLTCILIGTLINAFVIFLYLKNKRRLILLSKKKSKYLSNKAIDVFFIDGTYFPFKELIIRAFIIAIIISSISSVLFSNLVMGISNKTWFKVLLVSFDVILSFTCFLIGIVYDIDYKKWGSKVERVNINEQDFKKFINDPLQYKLNSNSLNKKLNKLYKMKYLSDRHCAENTISLLGSLISFTNSKENYFLDNVNKNKKQEFIKSIDSFYSSII